jgi:hypothetical protein
LIGEQIVHDCNGLTNGRRGVFHAAHAPPDYGQIRESQREVSLIPGFVACGKASQESYRFVGDASGFVGITANLMDESQFHAGTGRLTGVPNIARKPRGQTVEFADRLPVSRDRCGSPPKGLVEKPCKVPNGFRDFSAGAWLRGRGSLDLPGVPNDLPADLFRLVEASSFLIEPRAMDL